MKKLWNGRRFEILFAAALTVFTVYALLDTFVIPRQYAAVSPDADAVTLNEEITLNEQITRNPVQQEGEADAEETVPESRDAPEGRSRPEGRDRSEGRNKPENWQAPENWLENRDASENWQTPANWPENRDAPENWDGADFPMMPFPGRGNRDNTGDDREDSSAQEDAAQNGTAEGEVIRSWSDENISITITQYRASSTDVYVADVAVSSPEYLKTALAGNAYGRNIKDETSAIAAEHNAVLAINGDFYGARNSGYVIRSGTLYRESGQGGDVLAIMDDGSFQIVDDREVTAQELLDAGAVQALSFGPALVKDGEVVAAEGQGRNMTDNPRTAIGTLGNLHYVFVTVDGRSSQSQGMTLRELAEFLHGLGVETAYNLDGGGSSTMVFNGEIINHPTTTGRSANERSVSDIVYIGT